jgi:hypothetical protein
MTEQDKIWVTICQWVGNMEFLSTLVGMDFKLPVPLERENQQILLEFMQNYKLQRYEQWAGNRRAERLLFGTPFEEPIKEDGSREDDIDILWDFYINTIKRQLNELVIKLEELEGKQNATTTQS